MKRVWIFNHYSSEMYFNKGGRHYWFAKYLRRAGYEPVVFCCNAKHNSDYEHYIDMTGLWEERMAEEIETPFVFVQGRDYKGNGKQRVLNMVDFYWNAKKAAKEYAKENGKPDIILASSAHPLTLVAGLQLARRFGIKCICEVRDLWPESFIAYDLAGANNPMVIALRRLEKWIYKRTDALIFTAEGMYEYIREQEWEKDIPKEKVHYINNGVDLEVFDYNREHFQIKDEDIENPELFKVVYTGSIRRVNNLGLLLDAAKKVTNKKIRFLIWGDGNELEMLRQRVRTEKINNVIFKGRVDKCFVPYISSLAELNIVHGSPSTVLKYGISANKLFDYLASGKPVLSDFPCEFNPSVQCGAGFDIQNPKADKIADMIEKICSMSPDEMEHYGRNARIAAEQQYDYKVLTQKLLKIIEQ